MSKKKTGALKAVPTENVTVPSAAEEIQKQDDSLVTIDFTRSPSASFISQHSFPQRDDNEDDNDSASDSDEGPPTPTLESSSPWNDAGGASSPTMHSTPLRGKDGEYLSTVSEEGRGGLDSSGLSDVDAADDDDYHREAEGDARSDEGDRVVYMPGELTAPILGYETMEARSRFTVFKIHVQRNAMESGNWFVFRRYSDFLHLNERLHNQFPGFRLALPPKRWFRDNFDSAFLEERILGLQAFLNNITGHKDILNSSAVRMFLCVDNPPGPHDSLEESRALCESLEESVYSLRQELQSKEGEVTLLKEELQLYKSHVTLLSSQLRAVNGTGPSRAESPFKGENPHRPRSRSGHSLAECDRLESETSTSDISAPSTPVTPAPPSPVPAQAQS